MEQYNEGYLSCPVCGHVEDTPVQEALHMEPGNILVERYIIGKVLGFGGFGVTYIGWDAKLEQKVAIKEYLPSEFSTRIPGQTQITIFNGDKAEQFHDGMNKFVEEAQRLAKFHQEEGIVRIFDSFVSNNTAYIIMEYLHGETLADYIKREKVIPADKAIAMLMPVIFSLKAVNARGIIHRDVAPDNIFLTSDGKVKLIDFGAARFATTSHSRSLTVIIKPGYSPEEQYRSLGDQGSFTDVYAIGATLYRMITGTTPPDALERRAHFENKKKDILKPVSRYTRNITENQETAILNALNVRVQDRTPDMATLAEELMTEEPERVKRLYGKIRKVDLLRWPLWAKIGAPAAMFALILFSALFAFGIIGGRAGSEGDIVPPSGMSRVPSVINNDIDQAENRLIAERLLFNVVGRTFCEIVPPDLVLTQSENAGTFVLYNTLVDVYVSARPNELYPGVVPDVLFWEEDDAIAAIEGSNLIPEISREYFDTVDYGLVGSQSPDAGTDIGYGGTVYIVISLGSRAFAMPNVTGLSESEAREVLIESGLSPSVEYEPSQSVPVDYVIHQSILPDTDVRRGDVVVITVSSNLPVYPVPDVVGLPEEEAVDVLTEQHDFDVLVDEDESDTVPEGYVISQTPDAGSSQLAGATIVITVSTGTPQAEGTPPPAATPAPPVQVQVPDVVGQSQNSARNNLQDAGFSVSVREEHSSSVASGNVISQSPSAGSSQARGSTVTITVSMGPDTLQVADIVGYSQSSATSTLQNQGFVVSVTTGYSEHVPEGRVISQSPAGGSAAEQGNTVTIVVSQGPQPPPPSVTFSNMRVLWGRDPNNLFPTYHFDYVVENGRQVTWVGIILTASGDRVTTPSAPTSMSGSFQVSMDLTTEVGDRIYWRAVVEVDGQRFYTDTLETFHPGVVLPR